MTKAGGASNYPQFFAFVVTSIAATTVLTAAVLILLGPVVMLVVESVEAGALVGPSLGLGEMVAAFVFLLIWTVFFGAFVAVIGAAVSLTLGYAVWMVGILLRHPLWAMVLAQILVAALGFPAALVFYEMPEMLHPDAAITPIVFLVGLLVGVPVWFHVARVIYGRSE